jgi:hypothetical protein
MAIRKKYSRSHAADPAKSQRLKDVLAVLRSCSWISTWDIGVRTSGMATHSDIHELRCHGYDIETRYAGLRNGRKVYEYRLNKG